MADGNINLTIDGVPVSVAPGTLVIEAAKQAGVLVPHYCYHPGLPVAGVCRMCLVEIEKAPKLQIACATPVAEGMVVKTQTAPAKDARRSVLEFLLINHPLDCPVCDRGGECPLQDQTVGFGPGESRFVEEKRHWEKPIQLSNLVTLDRERCIQCDRCTRFSREVAGDPLISFMSRGSTT
ncbi:MAG: 2Fe-2S iron-sulfur cluster-binding protein, partial [Gemmatimonadales bacterium]